MDKQNVVYAYNLIVLNHKKEEVLIHAAMDEPQNSQARNQTEEVTYCMGF